MFGSFFRKTWINWLRKDIKRLWIEEEFFIDCLNKTIDLNITNLEEIPKDKLKEIEKLVKDIVFHIISLNTVVSLIWEEKIWENFDFSLQTCPKKAYKIAWANKLLPSQVTDYIRDRQLYVRNLLEPSFNKNPA